MAKLYAHTREVAIRLKAQARLGATGGVGGRATLLPKQNPGEHHYLFVLKEDMDNVPKAKADIYSMDTNVLVESDADVTNTLDWFSHMVAGGSGLCVKVKGVYYAVNPVEQQQAGAIVFTLNGPLDDAVEATASATVIISGVDGVPAPSVVTVYNTGRKRSWTGATGWAMLVNGQFWVAEVDQYPLQSMVVLSTDTHTFSAGATNQGKIEDQQAISTSSWDSLSPYPFSYLPNPLPSIANPHNLIGLSGDSGVVVWNDSYTDSENSIYGRFELIEVLPWTKRRLQFRLTADVTSVETVAAEDFEILQTREFTAGQVVEPSPKYLYDVMRLIHYGKSGDVGECEYSYRDGNWHIVSFRHRGDSILAKTPSTGIPACSSGPPYTFGSEECTVVKPDGTLSGESKTIKNIVNKAIAGNVIIKADLVGDIYVVDVASCGAA